MAEKVAEVKTLMAYEVCDNCNDGLMQFKGPNYYKDKNGLKMVKDYHHKCNNCGFEKDFHVVYPYTRYVPKEQLREPYEGEKDYLIKE